MKSNIVSLGLGQCVFGRSINNHIIGGDWGKDPDFLDQEYKSVACIRECLIQKLEKRFR